MAKRKVRSRLGAPKFLLFKSDREFVRKMAQQGVPVDYVTTLPCSTVEKHADELKRHGVKWRHVEGKAVCGWNPLPRLGCCDLIDAPFKWRIRGGQIF